MWTNCSVQSWTYTVKLLSVSDLDPTRPDQTQIDDHAPSGHAPSGRPDQREPERCGRVADRLSALRQLKADLMQMRRWSCRYWSVQRPCLFACYFPVKPADQAACVWLTHTLLGSCRLTSQVVFSRHFVFCWFAYWAAEKVAGTLSPSLTRQRCHNYSSYLLKVCRPGCSHYLTKPLFSSLAQPDMKGERTPGTTTQFIF